MSRQRSLQNGLNAGSTGRRLQSTQSGASEDTPVF
jgi:hypothetical protein